MRSWCLLFLWPHYTLPQYPIHTLADMAPNYEPFLNTYAFSLFRISLFTFTSSLQLIQLPIIISVFMLHSMAIYHWEWIFYHLNLTLFSHNLTTLIHEIFLYSKTSAGTESCFIVKITYFTENYTLLNISLYSLCQIFVPLILIYTHSYLDTLLVLRVVTLVTIIC